MIQMLRMEEVIERTALSRSVIYEMMNAGEFPAAVKVGRKAVRWQAGELDEWLANRPRVGDVAPAGA